jgi:hypothetical protein
MVEQLLRNNLLSQKHVFWGGRPRPRRTPVVRLGLAGIFICEWADEGVGRGPGGPPHCKESA